MKETKEEGGRRKERRRERAERTRREVCGICLEGQWGRKLLLCWLNSAD